MTEKIKDMIVASPSIIGTTTINHSARIELGLNCSEYVLMDHIIRCINHDVQPDINDTYRKTGFSEDQQDQILRGLILKGFILISEGDLKITNKWKQAFTNIADEFESLFWTRKGKVVWTTSSRKQAFLFYTKVRKNYPKEVMVDARNNYLDYLELEHKRGFNRQIMNVVKWIDDEFFLVDWKKMIENIKPEVEKKNGNGSFIKTEPTKPISKNERKEQYK